MDFSTDNRDFAQLFHLTLNQDPRWTYKVKSEVKSLVREAVRLKRSSVAAIIIPSHVEEVFL
jgi:hypothetical protein